MISKFAVDVLGDRLWNGSPYMLSDRCLPCLSVLSCPVRDVGVLWANGWMDQSETWHRGRPRPQPHCVRWGPSSPKGAQPPSFRPMSIVAKRSAIPATASTCMITCNEGQLASCISYVLNQLQKNRLGLHYIVSQKTKRNYYFLRQLCHMWSDWRHFFVQNKLPWFVYDAAFKCTYPVYNNR